MPVSPDERPGIARGLVFAMAAAAALTAANLYYNQPLLADMARGFHVGASAVGAIPVLTQTGYAVGLFFFVPLGDKLERRGLVVAMLLAVAASLVAIAFAPSVALLAVASLAMGALTVVPQILLPLAADLAAPRERGRVIGTVMGGLLVGILLARTVAGFVGARAGWRAMYALAAAMMLALALAARVVLPRSVPARGAPSYPALLGSLGTLVRTQPALREAAVFGALVFGAFSAFWSTLVFLLAAPPYHYDSRAAGLFGLVGVAGALAAPVVGRLADRKSPRLASGVAQAIALASFAPLALGGRSLVALVAGVVLLDAGTQANQVANQARIYALIPDARNRLNTVYMVTYFVGGALGTLLASRAWDAWRWNGVCAAGALLCAAALVLYVLGRRRAA